MDRFRHDHLDSDYSVAHGDSRLKEDLADAMRESPSAATSSKDAGKFLTIFFYLLMYVHTYPFICIICVAKFVV